MNIPEGVVNFNVYDEGNRLVGVSSEVTLPTLETMSETVSGAGIAGEYEVSNFGHFGSIQMEIPFRTLYDDSFSLFDSAKTIILRAAQQSFAVTKGEKEYRPLKITLKTLPKGLELGKLSPGKPTETKNTLEVLYIKIEENGKILLEVDKINFIFVIRGKDMLGNIRDMI